MKRSASSAWVSFMLLIGLLCGGCQALEPQPTVVYPEPPETVPDCEQVLAPNRLARWMEVVAESEGMSAEQILTELEKLDTSQTTRFDRFRYAMLNQHLNDRAGWIRARDTLQELTQTQSLEVDEVRLATLLMKYNQALINAEARRHQMSLELDAAQLARRELEQKIEALTSLEQNISIRREQAIEQQEAAEPTGVREHPADGER